MEIIYKKEFIDLFTLDLAKVQQLNDEQTKHIIKTMYAC